MVHGLWYSRPPRWSYIDEGDQHRADGLAII